MKQDKIQRVIALRREDIDKTGEKRTALVPELVRKIVSAGYGVHIQPAIHGSTGETKRAFPDEAYEKAGAIICEDLSDAQLILGLKEVNVSALLDNKTYFFFSHTHKGQKKNRDLLREMVAKKLNLIDYELIADEQGRRLLTAFTYTAGHAGMIDSLWALGRTWKKRRIHNVFEGLRQAIETEDLALSKAELYAISEKIRHTGTPAECPPLVIAFLGNGRTSQGAQEVLDCLPIAEASTGDLPHIFSNGSRNVVYKVVWDIPDMYKALPGFSTENLTREAITQYYLSKPEHFTSNLEQIFPYATVLMNCILWSEKYPRLLTYEKTKDLYSAYQTLQVVGDISCDPEGAIEFSRETWIDRPVFTYLPDKHLFKPGFDEEGISVMAITNLPCEFSSDASSAFSKDLEPYIFNILEANFEAEEVSDSGLPDVIQNATILWKGKFTPRYAYMQEYL